VSIGSDAFHLARTRFRGSKREQISFGEFSSIPRLHRWRSHPQGGQGGAGSKWNAPCYKWFLCARLTKSAISPGWKQKTRASFPERG